MSLIAWICNELGPYAVSTQDWCCLYFTGLVAQLLLLGVINNNSNELLSNDFRGTVSGFLIFVGTISVSAFGEQALSVLQIFLIFWLGFGIPKEKVRSISGNKG